MLRLGAHAEVESLTMVDIEEVRVTVLERHARLITRHEVVRKEIVWLNLEALCACALMAGNEITTRAKCTSSLRWAPLA